MNRLKWCMMRTEQNQGRTKCEMRIQNRPKSKCVRINYAKTCYARRAHKIVCGNENYKLCTTISATVPHRTALRTSNATEFSSRRNIIAIFLCFSWKSKCHMLVIVWNNVWHLWWCETSCHRQIKQMYRRSGKGEQRRAKIHERNLLWWRSNAETHTFTYSRARITYPHTYMGRVTPNPYRITCCLCVRQSAIAFAAINCVSLIYWCWLRIFFRFCSVQIDQMRLLRKWLTHHSAATGECVYGFVAVDIWSKKMVSPIGSALINMLDRVENLCVEMQTEKWNETARYTEKLKSIVHVGRRCPPTHSNNYLISKTIFIWLHMRALHWSAVMVKAMMLSAHPFATCIAAINSTKKKNKKTNAANTHCRAAAPAINVTNNVNEHTLTIDAVRKRNNNNCYLSKSDCSW